MQCKDCKADMKPLFTGFYCPNDCDRPDFKAAALSKKIAEAQDLLAKPIIWMPATNTANPSYGSSPSFGAIRKSTSSNYVPRNGQCRDAHCRGQGKASHTSNDPTLGPRAHFVCSTCNQSWSEPNGPANAPAVSAVPQSPSVYSPLNYPNLWN